MAMYYVRQHISDKRLNWYNWGVVYHPIWIDQYEQLSQLKPISTFIDVIFNCSTADSTVAIITHAPELYFSMITGYVLDQIICGSK